ncbi:hypothetical protein Poly30_32690 [Planctomycetes bacterium Poly30]|uniref:FecR protein domain-containing protein n=1 Tax=Saltatorellus ferox TaxID=2528018 RepID=A0A518EUL0_9BACT|nr:hypothetical protein Poly30_32690 [Planctomycetes bacterium Poly30]
MSPDVPERARLSEEELNARREELLLDVRHRLAGGRGAEERAKRGVSQSRIRMRTLLLPAFGILLFLHFGSRAGAPLGVHAAFTPGAGESFAGPRVFAAERSGADATGEIELAPGDVVGTTSGPPSTLELGKGRLLLDSGARAVVASLLPPRVRLLGGTARAEGRLRVVTAHGVYDLDSGAARLTLGSDVGLVVEQFEGEGAVIGPEGERKLAAGMTAVSW